MVTHLYKGKIDRGIWFLKRFGLREFFLKPIRIIFAPLLISTFAREKFNVDGKEYSLFYHRYNTTWANERCVEVPFIAAIARSSNKEILEIGNVLSHYLRSKWDILDKFEKGTTIINEDIVSYNPQKKYDLIVSISTFEHIGFDDTPQTKGKIIEAYDNVCKNLLKKKGTFYMTAPIGYNPEMDELIRHNRFGFDHMVFVKRVGKRKWKQVSFQEGTHARYGSPFPYANVVMIGRKDNR